MAPMPRLWLIDDTPSLHVVAERTALRVGGWDFTGWYTGAEAVAAVRAGEPLPDVILMDYYIGADRGDRVTVELRDLEPATHRPVIVGYSSVRSASQAIVAAGGDVIVRKHQDGSGVNPTLRDFLAHWR